VALVVAEWGPGTVNAYRVGMLSIDSLWYHMPIAARFAQSGSVVHLQNINNDNIIAFYPATSELLHAVGIVLMGSDVLSPVLNVAWLALALFAAWCLGSRFGVGSLAVMSTAVVMGTTELVADEPGGGYNDVVGVALILAGLALLAWWRFGPVGRADLAGLLVAAVAAGLSLGVKYTFVFPVIALTVAAVALAPTGRRLRFGLAWSAVVVAGGGLWYLRNAIEAGNPVPDVHVRLGGLHLPTPVTAYSVTVWHVLGSAKVWSTDIIPGLGQGYGPLWWLLSTAVVLGLVLGALAGSGPLLRSLAGVSAPTARPSTRPDGVTTVCRLSALIGLSTLIGYLVTPEPDLPGSFVYDLRFATLTILTGLLVLPLLAVGTRWIPPVLILLAVLLVGTQFAKGIWAGGPSLVAYHSAGIGVLAGGVVLVVGGALMVSHQRRWAWRLPVVGVSAVLACALLVGGFGLERFYLSHRYVDGPQPHVDRWASTVHRARIGVSGMILNYPLYGSDLTNDVTFIGIPEGDGAFAAVDDCRQWRRAINLGDFTYVVSDVSLPPGDPRSTTLWTQTDPAARFVVRDVAPTPVGYQTIEVFKITGRMDPDSC
jgi:hypothetical protein